jgi:methyl-accepting chemotaxis protein
MAKKTGSASGITGGIDLDALGKSIAKNLAEIQEATKRGEQKVLLAEQLDQQVEALEDYNKELEKRNLNIAERAEAEAKLIELENQRLKTERNLIKAGGESKRSLEEVNKLLAENREKLLEAKEASESLTNSMQLGSDVGSAFGNAIGVTDNKLDSFISNFSKGGISVKGFTQGLTKSINITKIATSFLTTMAQESLKLGYTVNGVNSQLRKDYGQFGNSIVKTALSLEGSLRGFNIGYEETVAAVDSLNVGVSDFVDMSSEQRDSLSRDSALLAKLGVSNEEYAESIQSMTKAFGDSTEGAKENMIEMRKFATAIGKTTKGVMSDFTKVRSYLAQFGNNYEKIFRRMETIARKTGASIEDLKGIALGFDEFDGAAESVGRLNALLGGPFLNTIDMLNTEDPAEQIMKIKQAFDASGKSVNSMTRRELQAFATTIPGINGDVEKLKTIFGQLDSGMLDTADSINAVLEGSKETTKFLESDVDASMSFEERQEALLKQMAASAQGLEIAANKLSDAFSFLNHRGEMLKFELGSIIKMAKKGTDLVKHFFGYGKEATKAAEAGVKTTAKTGTEAVVKTVAKEGAEAVGKRALIKTLGQTVLKKIPGVGLLMGLGLGLGRLAQGDIAGAGLEVASGAASTIPGIGTGVSLAIDAGIAARDIHRATSGPAMAAGGIVTKPVTNATIGEAGREAVIPLENGASHLVEPLTLALKQAMGTVGSVTPNITLRVELGGREMTAFVKQVIVDSLNPFK